MRRIAAVTASTIARARYPWTRKDGRLEPGETFTLNDRDEVNPITTATIGVTTQSRSKLRPWTRSPRSCEEDASSR
ncbi:MAG: hypothetical protein U0270_40580 [Labilithrix sp.]